MFVHVYLSYKEDFGVIFLGNSCVLFLKRNTFSQTNIQNSFSMSKCFIVIRFISLYSYYLWPVLCRQVIFGREKH